MVLLHFQRRQEKEISKLQVENLKSLLEETRFLLLKVCHLITRRNCSHGDPLGTHTHKTVMLDRAGVFFGNTVRLAGHKNAVK